jgi:hypothetical protein
LNGRSTRKDRPVTRDIKIIIIMEYKYAPVYRRDTNGNKNAEIRC